MSKARARLFELAGMVRRAADGSAVVFEHRDGGEGVALVRETRLNYLEDRVKQMDKQEAVPFTVAGSLASGLDDAALLAELKDLRKAWNPPPRGKRR